MAPENRNLRSRIGTAALLLPVALAATWQGGIPFALLSSTIAAGCAFELIKMTGPVYFTERLCVAMAALIPWSGLLSASAEGATLVYTAPLLATLGSLIFSNAEQQQMAKRAGRMALSLGYCALPCALLVALRQRSGAAVTLLALAATWGNDTLAYFVGRAWGRHKLMAMVSPKKSWEGFFGGAVGSLAAGAIGSALAPDDLPLPFALLASGGAALLGPLGDLVESQFKRSSGVKDSGALLPGHGGLLDRVDALLFVVPYFAMLSLAMG